jgi:tRNA A37 threonylcarbamoyladenosine biosynthesis protein TsaE
VYIYRLVGAGKTVFASGFTNMRVGNKHEGVVDVSSPTFLLDNTYSCQDGIVLHHMDLYRLKNENDCRNLEIDKIFDKKEGKLKSQFPLFVTLV